MPDIVQLQAETNLFGQEISDAPNIDREPLALALHSQLRDFTLDDFVKCFTNRFEAVIDYADLCAGENTGQRISLLFNPHRLDTGTKRFPISLYQALKDDKFVRGLARVVLLNKKKGAKRDILYASVGMGVQGTSYVQEFPPHVARDLALEYGLSKSSRVLDPCAGWGGRMLGFSAVVDSYTCCEPSTRTAAGLRQLYQFIRNFRSEFSATIHEAPFEDVQLQNGAYDFAMTSPPYYDTEWYAPGEAKNSFNRYPTFAAWVDGFYAPLIHRTMAALKPDKCFVINIGSRLYPLNEQLFKICEKRYAVDKQKGRLSASNGLGKTGEGETFYEVRRPSDAVIVLLDESALTLPSVPQTVNILTPTAVEPPSASETVEPVETGKASALDFARSLSEADTTVDVPAATAEPVRDSEPISEEVAKVETFIETVVDTRSVAEQLADTLRARGHRLLTREGKFFVSNAHLLTADERAIVKEHKSEFIAMAEQWIAPAVEVVEKTPAAPPAVAAESASIEPVAPPAPPQTLAQFLGSEPPREVLNWTPDEFPNIDNVPDVIVNFETNGLHWWEDDEPIGVTVGTLDGKIARFLPWGFTGGNLDRDRVIAFLNDKLRGKHITNANTKFDAHMGKKIGVDFEALGCTLADVQIDMALLDDNRRQFKIDILAEELLGGVKVPRVDESRMATYHASEVAERARYQATLVAELHAYMWPKIVAEGLEKVRKLECDVIYPVCEMERNGAPIDVELLNRWVKESQAQYEACLMDLKKETGHIINPNAETDLEKLFTHLGLPIVRLESGAPSFTDAILKRIDHPVIQRLRFTIKLSDLRSRYLLKIQKTVSSDGILRYGLNQTRYQKDSGEEGGVGPGRFSSSALDDGVGINIQQAIKITKQRKMFGYSERDNTHDDEIYLIRKLVIPREGKWLCADAEQIEYRGFSHYANNAKVIEAYKKNPRLNFHSLIEGLIKPFRPSMDYDAAKSLNFATIYGAAQIKQAEMLGFITYEEGAEIREKKAWNDPRLEPMKAVSAIYNRELPEVKTLLQNASNLAQNRGYVKTLLGRRSRFNLDKRFHKALNNVIQGMCADYNKLKLVEIHNARKDTGFLLRFTVHDEMDGDAREPETLERVRTVLDAQSWPELKVPFLWDVKLGNNWAEAK